MVEPLDVVGMASFQIDGSASFAADPQGAAAAGYGPLLGVAPDGFLGDPDLMRRQLVGAQPEIAIVTGREEERMGTGFGSDKESEQTATVMLTVICAVEA